MTYFYPKALGTRVIIHIIYIFRLQPKNLSWGLRDLLACRPAYLEFSTRRREVRRQNTLCKAGLLFYSRVGSVFFPLLPSLPPFLLPCILPPLSLSLTLLLPPSSVPPSVFHLSIYLCLCLSLSLSHRHTKENKEK